MTVQQRRMVSMGLSVACHAAMIAVIAYVPPVRRAIAPGDEQPVVAIMFVPAPAEPSAADLLIEEQEAAEASAPPEGVQLPGFEFDAARVRARQESLFPFLTHELRMLDDARAAVAAQAAKLTWASRTPPPRQS